MIPVKPLLSLITALALSACVPFLPGFEPDEEDVIQVGNSSYRLAWSEEFDGEGLPDPARWRFETGYVRNQEEQYYTDSRLENCRVFNGKLHLTARNDTFQGHPVTSASIETRDLHYFHYGFIQVRAKMPHPGAGTWPAIWMMGQNYGEVGWPHAGEIDIMEWVGRAPNVILGSLFLPNPNDPSVPAIRTFPYVLASPQIVTEAFHDYAIEWDESKIRYYMDGVNYVTYYRHDLHADSWAPLTQPHFLKLNLAMGGIIPPLGGGGPIDYSRFPYTFQVDYVRYYEPVP